MTPRHIDSTLTKIMKTEKVNGTMKSAFILFIFCFTSLAAQSTSYEDDCLVREMVVTPDCPYVSFCKGVNGILVYQETKHTARIVGMIFREDHKPLFQNPMPYDNRNVSIGQAKRLEIDLLKIARTPSIEQTLRIYDFTTPVDVVAKWDGYLHAFIPVYGMDLYLGSHIHIDLSWIHSLPEEALKDRIPNDGSILKYL